MDVCKICNKEFPSQRSLHAHIKAHGMYLGDYYSSFYPKFDKLTGEAIPFKTPDQYLRTDFRHKKNMYKWLDACDEGKAKEYCESVFLGHCEEKELIGKFAPNYLYLLTHPRLPKLEYFNKYCDYRALCDKAGLKTINTDSIYQNGFDLAIPKSLSIIEDTREQKPIEFDFKRVSQKLDFGDYALAGEDYNYVFVDRKAEDDFKGTMSAGHDRFCRELDRARNFGSYIFIVIESDMGKIYQNNNLPFKKKTNLDYTWERMRSIILGYSDVCQFVFTGSRENSKKAIPVILYHGNNFKNTDLQSHIQEFQWLG